jgi:hypothetical protein
MVSTVTKSCVWCGVSFTVVKAKGAQKACSKTCWGAYRTIPGKCIRNLRHGEPIPTSAPCRYIDSHGYVILRWIVSPGQMREAKEHRLVAGLPPDELDVHHKNGVKTDNRPENLEVMTRSQHLRLHHPPSWDVIQAAGEYESGATMDDIGRKYGIHPSTVFRVFRNHGIQSRNTTNRIATITGSSGRGRSCASTRRRLSKWR